MKKSRASLTCLKKVGFTPLTSNNYKCNKIIGEIFSRYSPDGQMDGIRTHMSLSINLDSILLKSQNTAGKKQDLDYGAKATAVIGGGMGKNPSSIEIIFKY